MPATLVPSKGALRTLRNLALGTSCTVAFGTGILTEDRRRRIHSAREVHENAKRLKSSRNYHSAGAANIETFEEQIMRYGDNAPSVTAERHEGNVGDVLAHWMPTRPAIPAKRSTLRDSSPVVPWKPVATASEAEPCVPKSEIYNRQHKLTCDIMKILASQEEPGNVDAAVIRFCDAFDEGLPHETFGLSKDLIDAAVQLSRICRSHHKMEASEKILDIILSCGPIDKEVFFSFEPEILIRACLSGPNDARSGNKILDEEKFRKGCALYLTGFKDGDTTDFPKLVDWGKLGLKLCREACRRKMFQLTDDLYWYLSKYVGEDDATHRAASYLITATIGRGDLKSLPQYFRFYAQSSPKQEEFYVLGNVIMDSLETQKPDLELLQKMLFLLLGMAEEKQLTASTTWACKALGNEWRRNRDMSTIRALFERLEPHLKLMGHPQAVYGAVIQFCIEANDEDSALSYYERMRETYRPQPNDVRIYGHFAYSKAMSKDWDGVREDFRHMRKSNPKPDEYSAAFTPILLLFAKSESIRQTENFIREFVDQFDVELSHQISNIMINKYLQAKEIESVSRWIDYMNSIQCRIDDAFFNMILINCHRQWKLNFEEVWTLFTKVEKLGKWTAPFINDSTGSTLHHIAISDSGNNIEKANKRLNQVDANFKTSSSFHSERSIREGMAAAMARGDPTFTLRLYRMALAEKIPLQASAVNFAVQASLRIHPENIDVTAALLQDSVQNGQEINDALSSIFIHQIGVYNDHTTNVEHIKEIAGNTMSVLESRGVSIPTRIVTHTMSTLRKRQQYRQAIDFWDSVSRREDRPHIPLDMATLTVLLQSYLALHDPVGLRWVMDMARTNNLVPDKRFKAAIKEARRTTSAFKWKMRSAGSFFQEILNAYDVCLELRAVAEEDKEDIKVKMIQIMEKAIRAENAKTSLTTTGSSGEVLQDETDKDTVCSSTGTKKTKERRKQRKRAKERSKEAGYRKVKINSSGNMIRRQQPPIPSKDSWTSNGGQIRM